MKYLYEVEDVTRNVMLNETKGNKTNTHEWYVEFLIKVDAPRGTPRRWQVLVETAVDSIATEAIETSGTMPWTYANVPDAHAAIKRHAKRWLTNRAHPHAEWMATLPVILPISYQLVRVNLITEPLTSLVVVLRGAPEPTEPPHGEQ